MTYATHKKLSDRCIFCYDRPMNIHDIRRLNLEYVLYRAKKMGQSRSLRALVSGSDLGYEHLARVRKKKKDMGGKTARGLEAWCKLPDGWMDAQHQREWEQMDVLNPNKDQVEKIAATLKDFAEPLVEKDSIPVLTLEEAANIGGDDFSLADLETIAVDAKTKQLVQPNGFAVACRPEHVVPTGSSQFLKSATVFVNPDAPPQDDGLVLVKTNMNSDAAFRRYTVVSFEGDQPNAVLQSIGGDRAEIPLGSGLAQILGAVVSLNLSVK